MAKKKRSSTAPVSYRFSPSMKACLDELVRPDGGFYIGSTDVYGNVERLKVSRKQWLERSFEKYLGDWLKEIIHPRQVNLAYAIEREGIFKLFVMTCCALRGEEGYAFTGDDPKTRFVVCDKPLYSGIKMMKTIGNLEKAEPELT